MNAAVIRQFGERPSLETFPEPVPGDGEVLIQVRAAALKPLDKQLVSGRHYASQLRKPPFVCGTDGVGCLEDGHRVFFAMPRWPYGAMAEHTLVPRSLCFPLSEDVDDCTAAAIFNPGLSAWASLTWRAKLTPGETVLILGATGVTGQLAAQTARLLGAGRVVAAGRNERVLQSLHQTAADAVIRLDVPDEDLAEALASEAAKSRFDVIIDYLWGRPTEVLLAAITRRDFAAGSSSVRLVQVGESAGPSISLPAAALRSSRLEILGAGSGSAPPPEMWVAALRQLMMRVAAGQMRIDTRRIALGDIEVEWERDQKGCRTVVMP